MKSEGVNTNKIVFIDKPGITTGFSYIIIDQQTQTRTVVHNPCEDLLDPNEIENYDKILDGVDLLLLDGKHSMVSHKIAEKAIEEKIPILMDGERECSRRPFYKEIIDRAIYLKCGENFPRYWTNCDDMLIAMSNLIDNGIITRKWVITTLGTFPLLVTSS